MKMYRLLLVVFVCLLAQSCTKDIAPEDNTPSGGEVGMLSGDVVKGWVRIKLEDNSAELRSAVFTRGSVESGNAAIDKVAAELGATEIRRVFPDAGKFEAKHRRYGLHLWYEVKIDEAIPVTRASEEFAQVPGVAVVEPIYMVKVERPRIMPADALYVPASLSSATEEEAPFNDPHFSKQWSLRNNGSLPHSVAGADINAQAGWEITKDIDYSDIVVAVLDSGVQFDHPDLADNMWINPGEIAGNSIDDDGNGYVDDIYGWNFIKKQYGGTITPGMHATHVAGIMAAVNNNNLGICGVAGGNETSRGVRIMTLQAYTDTEDGDVDAFPEMFVYAADNGAVIAQCSWVYSQSGMSTAISDAIDYFNAEAGTDADGNQVGPTKGGLCLFGAGNTGTAGVFYPARDPRVIGVSAMTADYAIAAYSNYGEGADLFAPGGTNIYPDTKDLFILSTVPGGKYGYAAGTSMATPHVAGVASLIIAKFQGPGFTGQNLKERLLRSYRPVGDYVDQKYNGGCGAGLVDASLIATEVPQGEPTAIVDAKAVPFGAGIELVCPVPVDGNNMPVAKFNLKYAEKVAAGTEQWVTKALINTYPAGESFKYKFSLKSEVAYVFQMSAVDRYGRETATVNFEGKTLRYVNKAPVLKKQFDLVSIKDMSKIRYYFFAEYFSDADVVPYGDKITYTAVSSNLKIATLEISNNNKITIYPAAKGSCTVTITATDKDGAKVEAVLNVTVLEGPDPDEDPTPDPDPAPDDFPAGISLYPNPVEEYANIHVKDAANAVVEINMFDAASRKVYSESKTLNAAADVRLNVSKLSPGVYSVVVTSGANRYTTAMYKR